MAMEASREERGAGQEGARPARFNCPLETIILRLGGKSDSRVAGNFLPMPAFSVASPAQESAPSAMIAPVGNRLRPVSQLPPVIALAVQRRPS